MAFWYSPRDSYDSPKFPYALPAKTGRKSCDNPKFPQALPVKIDRKLHFDTLLLCGEKQLFLRNDTPIQKSKHHLQFVGLLVFEFNTVLNLPND